MARVLASMYPTWSWSRASRPKYARSRSSTSAKMLRLSDTRGSRRCPASFQDSCPVSRPTWTSRWNSNPTRFARAILLNRARGAAPREERERRAELACEVVHAEIRAIGAQFFGGYRELDRLQKGIGRRADVGVWRWCPVPEGEKADPFHARYLREKLGTFGYACRPVQDSLSKKRYTAAIRPSLAMMKSVPAYSGASPGRPDTHWTRPPLPNSCGGTMG